MSGPGAVPSADATPRRSKLRTPSRTDATHNPTDPPGYYLITRAGISVRGMIRFALDAYGQDIRCYVCSRLSAVADESGECREWRVSVDHVDRGRIEGASVNDARDTVEQLAMAHLRRTKGIRVPPPSWTWSVLDADDREWWGRLDLSPAGAEIQFVQATSKREKRLPRDPDARPLTHAELRALVSRIRHT